VRRRAAARLADGDADAREQELDVVLREAAQGRHARPDRQRRRDDRPPRTGIRQARDGDAEAHIEDREGETGQEAELLVGKQHLLLDRLLQDDQQLPVDEVERVDDREQCEHGVAIGAALVGLGPEDRHGLSPRLCPRRPWPSCAVCASRRASDPRHRPSGARTRPLRDAAGRRSALHEASRSRPPRAPPPR